jgi:hypothetical protein
MTLMVALIGWLLSYLGFASYAPTADSRMSNGYHPIAVALAGLEVGLGIFIAIRLGALYARWYRLQRPQLRLGVLLGWGILFLGAVVASLRAYRGYTQQMPPVLGSYFSFYFATPSLWVVALAALGLVWTVRHLLAGRPE